MMSSMPEFDGYKCRANMENFTILPSRHLLQLVHTAPVIQNSGARTEVHFVPPWTFYSTCSCPLPSLFIQRYSLLRSTIPSSLNSPVIPLPGISLVCLSLLSPSLTKLKCDQKEWFIWDHPTNDFTPNWSYGHSNTKLAILSIPRCW